MQPHNNWLATLLLALLVCSTAHAHQMRSVLLTVTEHTSGQVFLDLKSSLNKNGTAASVVTQFTPACTPQGQTIAERLDDAILRRYTVRCDGGLQHRQLHLHGLDPTTPDAFVTVHFANDQTTHHGLSRNNPVIDLQNATQTASATRLWAYFGIGVEHIIFGADHLLFVLGLLLLLQQTGAGWRTLLTTITAFTVAHSITLGLASGHHPAEYAGRNRHRTVHFIARH